MQDTSGISVETSSDLLFHTTKARNLKRILRLGELRGSVSFTHNPHLGIDVAVDGYTFVFPADIIYEKYHGRDIDYEGGEYVGLSDAKQARDEAEVVVSKMYGPIDISDAIEVLQAIPAVRKYAGRAKHHYKDIRERPRIPTMRDYAAYGTPYVRKQRRDLLKELE